MIFPALAAAAPSLLKIGGGLLSGIGGGLFGGGSAAKDQAKLAQLQQYIQGTAFSPIGVSMPGGGGISFGGGGGGSFGGGAGGGGGGFFGGQTSLTDPRTGKSILRDLGGGFRQVGHGKKSRAFQSDIGNIGLGLGDLEPARAGLANFAGGLAGMLDPGAGQGISNMGLMQALSSGGGLDALSGLVGNQLGGAAGDINNFRNTFQDPLQQGILSAIGDASLTGQQAADKHLALLREQAQPFEERQFAQHQDNQFMTGQRGTSGGALQTEAFARGLGQADLSRQLAASQEGRNATQMALSQASGLGGLQEQMLTGAMGRFGSLASLAQGLSGQRFNQGQALSLLPGQIQSGQLGNLGQALQGLTGLTNISTVPANIALNFMNAQAQTRLGQGNSIGSNLNALTAPQAARSDMLSSLGGAISQNAGGIASGIGSFFDLFKGGG